MFLWFIHGSIITYWYAECLLWMNHRKQISILYFLPNRLAGTIAIAPDDSSSSVIFVTAATIRCWAALAVSQPKTESCGAAKNWSAIASNSLAGRKPVDERSFSPNSAIC